MKNFTRTLNPGTVEEYANGKNRAVPVFVKVELKEGRLSLSGVVGPRSNGDAWGSCGQIVDTLARPDFVPVAPWDSAQVDKLRQLWDRWHLNDMRANCEHQRALGWLDKVGMEVTLYHWWLTRDAAELRKDAQRAALRALESGEDFHPTAEQAKFARLAEWLETWSAEAPEHYEARAGSVLKATEVKRLGWLRPEEHPEGLLCRPCPTCGYGYGSQWRTENVPEDVLEFLAALPESSTAPAWC